MSLPGDNNSGGVSEWPHIRIVHDSPQVKQLVLVSWRKSLNTVFTWIFLLGTVLSLVFSPKLPWRAFIHFQGVAQNDRKARKILLPAPVSNAPAGRLKGRKHILPIIWSDVSHPSLINKQTSLSDYSRSHPIKDIYTIHLTENKMVHEKAMLSAANNWVQNGCHICRQADSCRQQEAGHQMHHMGDDSVPVHMPPTQWLGTIGLFYYCHEQDFRVQGCLVIDWIWSLDRAFTMSILSLQPSTDSSGSLEFVM